MILLCDYSGFKAPEMVKKRPVVVLCRKDARRYGVCTIVPLSTSAPRTMLPYQPKIRMPVRLPPPFESEDCWVKADMINTVSYERLNHFREMDATGRWVLMSPVIGSEIYSLIQASVTELLSLTAPDADHKFQGSVGVQTSA